jgi:hypothetical protein
LAQVLQLRKTRRSEGCGIEELYEQKAEANMQTKNNTMKSWTLAFTGLSLGVGCVAPTESDGVDSDIGTAQAPQPVRLVYSAGIHTGCALNSRGAVKCFTLNELDNAVVTAPTVLSGFGSGVEEISGAPRSAMDGGGMLCARFVGGAVKCSVPGELQPWGTSNTLLDLSAELPGTTMLRVVSTGWRETTVCGINTAKTVRCTHIGRVDRPRRNNEPVVYDLKLGSIDVPQLGDGVTDIAMYGTGVFSLSGGNLVVSTVSVVSSIKNGEISPSVSSRPTFSLPSPAATLGLLASGKVFLYGAETAPIMFAPPESIKIRRLVGFEGASTGGFNPTPTPNTGTAFVLDDQSHLNMLIARKSGDLVPWTPAEGLSAESGRGLSVLRTLEASDVSVPAVRSTRGDVFIATNTMTDSHPITLLKVEGM